MKYINLTSHTINMNDGRKYKPSGKIARVSITYSAITEDICTVTYTPYVIEEGFPDNKQDFPNPIVGVRYIVSSITKLALMKRKDVVHPIMSHPEVNKEIITGKIVSIPCFTN